MSREGSIDTRPLLQDETKQPEDVESQIEEQGKKAVTLSVTPILAEFFGTALLTATAGFNSSNPGLSGVESAITVASVLVVLVYAVGHVSGCHVNPAVTLFMLLLRKIALPQGLLYVVSQVCGALFGAQLSYWVTNTHTVPPTAHGDATWVLEIIFTFLLVTVVIHTATNFNVQTGSAIGALIAAGAYLGAGMNPAVVTGLYGAAKDVDSGDLWYFWILPLIGSVLAYVVYRGLLPFDTDSYCFAKHDVQGVAAQAAEVIVALRAYIMEFLGTFTLAITVGLGLGQGISPAMPVIMVLFCMIQVGGSISGANYNPAVSVALLLRDFQKSKVLPTVGYIISQTLGAIAAAAISRSAFSSDVAYPTGAAGMNNTHVAMAEAVGTMVLCFTVLMVASTQSQSGNQFFGVAISLALWVGVQMVGRVSGGCLNPAIATGLYLVNASSDAINSGLGLYWAGPLLGAVFAVAAFFLTYTQTTKTSKATTSDDFVGTYLASRSQ